MKLKESFLKIFILVLVALCIAPQTNAKKVYVPGMSNFGVSTKKRVCPVCGTEMTEGSSHLCERPYLDPTYTPPATTVADDRAARGAIDNDPRFLSNQCSFDWTFDPNAGQDGDDGNSSASDVLNDYRDGALSLDKEESHTGRNIMLVLAAVGVGWWFVRRKK